MFKHSLEFFFRKVKCEYGRPPGFSNVAKISPIELNRLLADLKDINLYLNLFENSIDRGIEIISNIDKSGFQPLTDVEHEIVLPERHKERLGYFGVFRSIRRTKLLARALLFKYFSRLTHPNNAKYLTSAFMVCRKTLSSNFLRNLNKLFEFRKYHLMLSVRSKLEASNRI